MKTDIVIPVFNEERRLAVGLPNLHRFLSEIGLPDWRITVVNNGSNDRTQQIAEEIGKALDRIQLLWIPEKGRGRALKRAWLGSQADILVYMDVDLSSHLDALQTLIDAVASGAADLAIGSRLVEGAQVSRSWHRHAISLTYLFLARLLCGLKCSDTQCGFKALSATAAKVLLPEIRDNEWFFDTELVIKAERSGRRIIEVPVHWTEEPDSRVKLLSTAWRDLQGLRRLRREVRARPLADRCREALRC